MIRDFIRLVLEDSTRRNTGIPFDLASQLKKFVTDSQPPRYFFTMTELPKVGVNPGSKYNTPLGVYTYPLNSQFFQMLIRNELPFQSDTEFFSVVEAIEPDKMLRISRRTPGIVSKSDYENIMNDITQHVWHLPYDECRVMIDDLNNFSHSPNLDARLYGNLFVISRKYNSKIKQAPIKNESTLWNSLFRKAGITAVYDAGSSIIHENEPTQCVFLSPRAYRIIGTWRTADLRRHGNPKIEINPKIVQKAAAQNVPAIRFINPKLWPMISVDFDTIIDFSISFTEQSKDMELLFDMIAVNQHGVMTRGHFRRIVAFCLEQSDRVKLLTKLHDVIANNPKINWPPPAHFLMMLDPKNISDPATLDVLSLCCAEPWLSTDESVSTIMKKSQNNQVLHDSILRYDQSTFPNIHQNESLRRIKIYLYHNGNAV